MKDIGTIHPILRAGKRKDAWRLVQCLITVVTIFFCLLRATAAGASGPVVVLDKQDLDFGDVQVGRIVQARASVSNKGDAPLLINEVRTSCGCTKAESAAGEISPGEKSAISISYNSTGLSPGRKTQTVFIKSNDLQNPLSKIQIFANIVHPLSIDPSSLIVRLSRFQEHVSSPITARNNSQQPATISVSSLQGAITKARLQPENFTIEPGSEARLTIEMDIQRPKKGNTLTGELLIATNLPDASQIKLRCLIKIDEVE